MTRQSKKLVVPDGGWGWMVCLGCSMINLSLRSLDASFGQLFGDLLRDLKVDTVGASVVMSTLDAVFSFSGLIVGPLLKKLTYRKAAIFGSLLSCTGLILTSQANSLAYIIVTYSVLGGLGTGIAKTTSFVSMNTYFNKKRTQAVGLALVGTSLGAMCMPLVVHFLLIEYDFRGAVLILGANALHSVVGGCLLQPVAWHLKPEPDEKDMKLVSSNEMKERDALLNAKKIDEEKRFRKVSIGSISPETTSINLMQTHWKDEKTTKEVQNPDENSSEIGKKQKAKNSFIEKLVNFFDLTLLKDRVYLNIVLGMSLYYEAEMNFKLITPFFLRSIGMSKADVALSLSLIASADLLARLLTPTIFMKLKLKNRNVFWLSSSLIGITRFVIAGLMPGKMLFTLIAVSGFLRGIAVTNLDLSVVEHCATDVLPAALGISNVARGVSVVVLGPLVGYIRDATESYPICIRTTSGFIALCSTMWGIEFVVTAIRTRKSKSSKSTDPQVDLPEEI